MIFQFQFNTATVPYNPVLLCRVKPTKKRNVFVAVACFPWLYTMVIHFLWLHCSTFVLVCLVFQSIVCTGMMKWYPDPQHIHCIQSCEVRAKQVLRQIHRYVRILSFIHPALLSTMHIVKANTAGKYGSIQPCPGF